MGILNRCPDCLDKQIEIDRLKTRIESLMSELNRYKKKTKDGYFGESTPSSQKPFKENSTHKNNGGAKKGHAGHGRSSISEDSANDVIMLEHNHKICPDCGGVLDNNGYTERSIIDGKKPETTKLLYKCKKSYCPKCKKIIILKPDVLPKNLYGNTLLSSLLTMHYVHGIPLSRLIEVYGNDVGVGGIINTFHNVQIEYFQ